MCLSFIRVGALELENQTWEERGHILGENHVFQRPPTEQCPVPPDNV
jgi:hypothetical protein